MDSVIVVRFGVQIFHDNFGAPMNAPAISDLNLAYTSFHDAL
jgi:hypothetical protein